MHGKSALYSASLTAFIIESYKNLQQDPKDVTVFLLGQILQQLASNDSSVKIEISPPFHPPVASLVCNIMWFLSLALALTCSLLATFVQQWTRDFLHKTSMRPSPIRHARILAFAYFGMKDFGMHTLVDAIPMFLHVSLFLFFAGLIGFLLPVNRILTYIMAGTLVIIVTFYFVLSWLPVLRPASPYRTPFSNALWHWASTFDRWFLPRRSLNAQLKRRATSLTEVVLQKSLDDTNDRDLQAIKYTMRSLTDDAELLPLIEAIPDLIYGPDGVRHANVQLIAPFLDFSDPQLNILSRMASFMGRSGAWTDPTFRARSITTCHKTLSSMALMLLQNQPLLRISLINNGHRSIWFDQHLRKAFKPSVLIQTDHTMPLTTKTHTIPWALAAICLVREYSRLIVTSQMLNKPSGTILQLREEVDYVIEICSDTSWGLDLNLSQRTPNLGESFSTLKTMFFSSTNVLRINEIHLIFKEFSQGHLRALRQQWLMNLIIIFCELILSSLEMKSFPHELTLICQTIIPDLIRNQKHFFEPQGNEGEIIHKVFQVVRREITNKRLDSVTDEVMGYLLLLLGFLIEVKPSHPRVKEGREVIQSYVVERDRSDWLALKLVRDRDGSLHFEECILHDLTVDEKQASNEACVTAAWHLCQNMNRDIMQDTHASSSCHDRLYNFGNRLFDALRTEKARRHHKHGIYPILKVFVDWIVINDILEVMLDTEPSLPRKIMDQRSINNFRLLVEEFLTKVTPSYVNPEPQTQTMLINSHLPDVVSVNVVLIAQFMMCIAADPSHGHGLEAQDLASVFQHMTSFLYHYEGDVHKRCQDVFGQGIWKLVTCHLAVSRRGETRAYSEVLAIVFKMSRSWKWVNSSKCADLISKAIENHLGSNGYVGHEEELRNRCRAIACEQQESSPLPTRPTSPSRELVSTSELHQDETIDADDSENENPDLETLSSMHGFWEDFQTFKDSPTSLPEETGDAIQTEVPDVEPSPVATRSDEPSRLERGQYYLRSRF
ncbi:hypothetical protein VKT23_009400 [Stygiomarasmius scandens]|uniref:DUF6535 domain-containing protein n=1 Tax=Marasmiellus scandens TaxID=2682957 RepID=A0ABR1JHQ7_9AGAR